MKKLLTLSVFLFIPVIAILFVQCSESTMEPNDQESVLSLDKGEPLPNNLSFPGLLADGYIITPITYLFTTEFTYDDLLAKTDIVETCDYFDFVGVDCGSFINDGPWYAQKVVGNNWQADFDYVVGTVDVDVVDWGDNMESFSPTQGKPFRVEFSLFKDLEIPMAGYTMALLANPSSPDEIQGTNTVTYESYEATIASDKARLVIQHLSDDVNWVWKDELKEWGYNDASGNWVSMAWSSSSGQWGYNDASNNWVTIGTPETVVFGVELNVAGKLIYGAAQHGWRPAQSGKYRITYYLDDSEVNLSSAAIGPAPTDQVAWPKVDATNNLTYVDIVVAPRTSGNVK